ncbi:MAG: DMT family transporter [Deltaproteobacteria bacterium]|nr:DMT family transporter [Deltaproteobacteria bacterium]MBW2139090.1 DMT family transporter [Deltaproteobacteria bacterium]
MPDQRKAYTYGLLTVLLWSTVASAFKLSLRYVDYVQLLLYASVVSLLLLGFIAGLQGKARLLLSFSRRQWLRSLVLGFLNPFLYYVVLFKAYELLPAQEAQPLNYTWAITLSLLSIPLLKQKISLTHILALFVSYAGVLVIGTRGEISSLRFSDPVGVGLALGSTIIWSLYWIYNTKDDRDPVLGLFLNFLFGLPFILIYCLLFSGLRVSHFYGYIGASYVGTFEMGITFILWLSALKRSENTAKIANLIFLSPFVSLVFIHFLVGEDILLSTLVGLVLIVLGLFIQQSRRRTLQA